MANANDIKKQITLETGKKHSNGFFLLFFFFLFLTLWISFPLLNSLAWASILAFIADPIRGWISRRGKMQRFPNLVAALTLILLLMLFLIPLLLLGNMVGQEIYGVYKNASSLLVDIKMGRVPNVTEYIPQSLMEYLTPFFQDKQKVNDAVAKIVGWSASIFGKISSGALQWTGNIAFEIMMTALFSFFLIRDGHRIVASLQTLMPLSADESVLFFEKGKMLLRSIFCGVLLTVAIQALLGGLGWWYVGLPKAFLAGSAMFIVGLFPAGTAVIWLPGALYLLASGQTMGGVLLLIWGVVVVSAVDNLLRPFLMAQDGSVPTLAILVGLIGGLLMAGLLGVFLGPLVVALFLLILDIYGKKQVRDSADYSFNKDQ